MSVPTLSRRRFLQGMGVAATGAVMAACAPPPAQQASGDMAETAETPEVWVFVVSGCAAGGNPEKTKAVQDVILEESGVLVQNYLTAHGTASVEKLNLLIASGTQPLDLFEGQWPDFKGIILPMDDLLEAHGQNILALNNDFAWARMKDADGVTWGYPRLGLMAHTHFCFFRSDWLDEAGLEVPDTWDGMEATIEAFRGIHDDSVTTTMGRTHLMYNTLGAFTENGFSNWVDPADNMLKPVETSPGYVDWLAKMNEWWENGWFQLESFANPDFRAMLKTLTIGTWLGWYSRMTIWWEQIRLDAGYTDIDYAFPETMTGPMGLAKTNNVGGNSAYMIPRKSQHPDAVIRFANWAYAGLPDEPRNLVITQAGTEGVDWEWHDKEQGLYRALVPATAPCEDRYASDYYQVKGMGTEPHVVRVLEDGTVHRQSAHVVEYNDRFELGKMPIDFDVPYDLTAIRDSFPGLPDFQRLVDEESVKFITGVRPLSEFGDFMDTMNRAGLDQWSELHTEQYLQYHP